MSLVEDIKNSMKEAMLKKDTVKLSVFRMLNSEIKNAAIDKRKPTLDDAEVIAVVSKMIKQHRDSITDFEKAERPDLVEQEKKELDILSVYMPAQMSEDDVRRIVKDAVAEVGAGSIEDLGKVMKAVMSKVKGQADGTLVNKIVREELVK